MKCYSRYYQINFLILKGLNAHNFLVQLVRSLNLATILQAGVGNLYPYHNSKDYHYIRDYGGVYPDNGPQKNYFPKKR
jgi:predicted Rossmann fold nucleotide-binding protein DprA/Smf involved in DNA uptake